MSIELVTDSEFLLMVFVYIAMGRMGPLNPSYLSQFNFSTLRARVGLESNLDNVSILFFIEGSPKFLYMKAFI